MIRKQFKNGITFLGYPTNTKSCTLMITIRCGSIDEKPGIFGISHFIEHLMFEGTKNRTAMNIASTIENLGGEINAATSGEYTYYYIKIKHNHLKKAIDILGDVFTNSLFTPKSIEKERKVILSEIKMVLDQPRHYQWILFQEELFKGTRRQIPIYGTEHDMKKISRVNILSYFKKHYVGSNIIISLVGPNIDHSYAEKKFSKIKKGTKIARKLKFSKPSRKTENRKIKQSYIIYGHQIPPLSSKRFYTFAIIRSILGKPLSGKIFKELRLKRAIGYDTGVHIEENPLFSFISCYASTDQINIDKVINIFKAEFEKLKKTTEKELKEAKQFLEGEIAINMENTDYIAEKISLYELSTKAEDFDKFSEYISNVSLSDITREIKRLKAPTITILKQNS